MITGSTGRSAQAKCLRPRRGNCTRACKPDVCALALAMKAVIQWTSCDLDVILKRGAEAAQGVFKKKGRLEGDTSWEVTDITQV